MPTMFRTTYNDKIEAREVVKVTASTVVYIETFRNGSSRETRENRVAEWHSWHGTWEEAHDYLLKQAESKVKSARLALGRANGEYGNIKGMKKPKPTVE